MYCVIVVLLPSQNNLPVALRSIDIWMIRVRILDHGCKAPRYGLAVVRVERVATDDAVIFNESENEIMISIGRKE
jgi:hypothetical protein